MHTSAQRGDKAIGSAVMVVKEVAENAFHYQYKRLYIDQISVLAEYQKTGAGKLLLTKAEELARELSIHRLELDNWTANTVAADYFNKNGYLAYREMRVKMISP